MKKEGLSLPIVKKQRRLRMVEIHLTNGKTINIKWLSVLKLYFVGWLMFTLIVLFFFIIFLI